MASGGSVYKRCPCGTSGTPGRPACKKAHGTWWWRAESTRDPATGKRKQPGQGGYSTKDEAQDALTKYLAARSAGTWADDQRLTVGEWLNRWLDDVRDDVDLKTWRGYSGHVQGVLIPHLGRHRLRDLRRHHIEAMIRDLRRPAAPPVRQDAAGRPLCTATTKAGRPCSRTAAAGDVRCGAHGGRRTAAVPPGPGRGGRHVEVRAPRTLDSYRRTLRASLAAAVRRGLVPINVAEGRIEALPTIGRADTQWWQPDEVGAFLDSVQGDRLVAAFEVAAFAGLRRGELLGLRWADVDITGDVPGVVISQTLASLSGEHACPGCGGTHKGRRFKPRPKTDAGRRWVPLVGATVRELLAHQAAQAAERAAFGSAYSDHGLVFCQEDGTPLNPDSVTKRFEQLADAVRFPDDAGQPDGHRRRLPPIRLHDMRHGAASLLLAAGVPVEMVAMMLGHASPAVTRAVYAHVLREPARRGMEAAAALVRRPDEGASA